MAQITFPGLKAYGDALKQLEIALQNDDLLKEAVWAGAQPVADEVRRNIEAIQPGDLVKTSTGWLYRTGPTQEAKQAMLDGLGIAPPRMPNPGEADTKVGFDGFFGPRTARYPRGYSVRREAYAWEHGSSMWAKHPFVRPAVKNTRKEAVREMDKSINDGLKKIFER